MHRFWSWLGLNLGKHWIAVLLVGGIAVQGLPRLSAVHWAIIAWLAVVNTAFAFTLWNRTLRTLSAMESSILNNTMMFQIAVLAWLFLGEELGWAQVVGMVLAGAGTLVVQVRRRAGPEKPPGLPDASRERL